jgi:hypothetical protein
MDVTLLALNRGSWDGSTWIACTPTTSYRAHAHEHTLAGEGLISLSAYRLYRMLATDLAPQQDTASRGGQGSAPNLDSLIPDDAIPDRT